MLSKAQVDQFWENGSVVAENGATVEQLNDLSVQMDEWIEQRGIMTKTMARLPTERPGLTWKLVIRRSSLDYAGWQILQTFPMRTTKS